MIILSQSGGFGLSLDSQDWNQGRNKLHHCSVVWFIDTYIIRQIHCNGIVCRNELYSIQYIFSWPIKSTYLGYLDSQYLIIHILWSYFTFLIESWKNGRACSINWKYLEHMNFIHGWSLHRWTSCLCAMNLVIHLTFEMEEGLTVVNDGVFIGPTVSPSLSSM